MRAQRPAQPPPYLSEHPTRLRISPPFRVAVAQERPETRTASVVSRNALYILLLNSLSTLAIAACSVEN